MCSIVTSQPLPSQPLTLLRKNTQLALPLSPVPLRPTETSFWMEHGLREIKEALERPKYTKKAKNVILFLGDGELQWRWDGRWRGGMLEGMVGVKVIMEGMMIVRYGEGEKDEMVGRMVMVSCCDGNSDGENGVMVMVRGRGIVRVMVMVRVIWRGMGMVKGMVVVSYGDGVEIVMVLGWWWVAVSFGDDRRDTDGELLEWWFMVSVRSMKWGKWWWW